MKKIFKDLCDECNRYKPNCHGFGGKIICKDCANAIGLVYERKEKDIMEETIQAVEETKKDEKFFENGTKAVTMKDIEKDALGNIIQMNFFENGTVVNTKYFKSSAGAFKARKKWLGL